MRRTDRLFEIIQMFRSGRLVLGRDIAEKLEVSLRTIYRDIETLVGSGIPIEGERGVGYILREPIFLPPLTLTNTELEALQLGVEIVRKMPDAALSSGADALLEKINAVLPDQLRGRNHLKNLSVLPAQIAPTHGYLSILRVAIANKQIVKIDYMSLRDTRSTRTIRPLDVEYWGQAWTCTAWCELRRDFRVFRIDKIETCTLIDRFFKEEPGKTFSEFIEGLNLDHAHNRKPEIRS